MRKTVYQKWEMGKQNKEKKRTAYPEMQGILWILQIWLLLTKLFLISLLDITFIAPSTVLPFPVLP